MANKVVNEVWESCFKDTRPFDEVSLAIFISVHEQSIQADVQIY